jgi:acyl carrier protein
MDHIDELLLDYFGSRNPKAGGVNGGTRLLESGILDSLELMSLVTYVEEHYAFNLPEEEYVPENFQTPTTIARMIRRVLAGGCGVKRAV